MGVWWLSSGGDPAMMSCSARRLLVLLSAWPLLLISLACGGDDPQIVPTAPSISGTIFAAESQYTDSDVNTTVGPAGPSVPVPISNGASFFEAQAIPVPAIVGGFVCAPGDCERDKGSALSPADERDYFVVDLRAGEAVTLVIAEDPATVDLDLRVYDENEQLAGESIGLGATESWTVGQDGRYFIEIFILSHPGLVDASNYTLFLGGPAQSAAARFDVLDVEADFVPGQVIVTLKRAAMPATAASTTRDALAASIGMRALAGAPDRPMLFDLGHAGERSSALQMLAVKRSESAHRAWLAASPDVQAKLDTVMAVRALRARPDVEHADLNYRYWPLFEPNDEHYPLQWHYPLINLPLAWDLSATRGASALVAVIDTGILPHPDLQGQYSGGFDFIADADNAIDGQALAAGSDIDADPTDPGDGDPGSGLPHSYHGTHVAGTIAAATENGIGVAGVAFGAHIVPLRVCGVDGCTGYDIIQAVRYASGLSSDSPAEIPQPVDVINLSLGGPRGSTSEQNAYDAARAQGVIVVAAAGNEANSGPMFPASYDGVISVSAVDLTKNLAHYSSFGPRVDVAAPGGDTSRNLNGDPYVDGVLSTLADEMLRFNYVFYQGTSMAAPHMAGVAALMRGDAPNMTPDQLDAMLGGTSALSPITEDLGAPGRDDSFGHGLIDARLAVQAAIELAGGAGGVEDARLVVTPTSLGFPARTRSRVLSVTKGGQGALSLLGPIAASETWLEVTDQAVNVDGLGTYRVTLVAAPFALLADGTQRAMLTIPSTNNTIFVEVLAQKGGEQYPNTGYQFLLLLDPDDGETVESFNLPISRGRYDYSLSEVESGDYILVVGSDLDNDNFICDEGEACGAYPQLDDPQVVRIDRMLRGYDFTTSYPTEIQSMRSTLPAPIGTTGYPITPPRQTGHRSTPP
ncbi:MAG: S8 family peptidase [Deltaproteobacteria bacterium]|nr:S8 family peptidase [Deltaproteobacteria bacterium]